MTPKLYKNYTWLIQDPEYMAGQITVKGTRLTIAHVLECLAAGFSREQIQQTFGTFPIEAMSEIFQVSAEIINNANVAA